MKKTPTKGRAGTTTKAKAKAGRRPPAAATAAKKTARAKSAGRKPGAAAAGTRPGTRSRPSPPRAAKAGAAIKPERRAVPRPAPASLGAPGGPVAPALAESSGEGCYVYCIIRSSTPLRFGAIGLGAQPSEVRTINYRDLAAVVSDTPLEVYDPTRENVLAHERVNDSVMREHTVLPMSFGTVFKTPQDIVELMRSAYDAFRDVLAKMEDKVEFGLKILWEPEAVIREIERRDENLRRVKEEISSQRGSTYFARMQYGRLVDSLLQERSAQLVSEIFETLRGVAIASRSNKPIGDKMILNAAFLVGRDREAEFDARVKEIGARHEHLNIRYTGPWPPYNFVNVRLKLERATED